MNKNLPYKQALIIEDVKPFVKGNIVIVIGETIDYYIIKLHHLSKESYILKKYIKFA
jgi:hypothetical protein